MNLTDLGERLCRGGPGLRVENRQLMFGSRWGAALSTGAAQMPLKAEQAPVIQGHWDTLESPDSVSPTALASAQPFSWSN